MGGKETPHLTSCPVHLVPQLGVGAVKANVLSGTSYECATHLPTSCGFSSTSSVKVKSGHGYHFYLRVKYLGGNEVTLLQAQCGDYSLFKLDPKSYFQMLQHLLIIL